MRTRVAIVSGHSLFAEGVASRLKNHLDRLDLQMLDINEDDVFSKIVSLQPATVILEALEMGGNDEFPLNRLLKSLPDVTVICLDPLQSHVQVVTSKERTLGEVKDLIEVIQENH